MVDKCVASRRTSFHKRGNSGVPWSFCGRAKGTMGLQDDKTQAGLEKHRASP